MYNKYFDKNIRRQRVILLQGPHGPFFNKLRFLLSQAGYETIQVALNAGDHLFAGINANTLTYKGGKNHWEAWLHKLLVMNKITHVVLYGSERPAHKVARQLADRLGLTVISLEEGYIRPGNITVEFGANNAQSPIAGRLPPRGFRVSSKNEPSTGKGSFVTMCFYGALYYAAVSLFTNRSQKELLHRHIDIADEVLSWSKNLYRRLFWKSVNITVMDQLLEHHAGRYFIIPLQVSQDTQMKSAARGWNNGRLIREALQSFAACAPSQTRLVFKIHPFERGRNTDRLLIQKTIAELGMEQRVDIIDIGSIGDLTRHSAGMITINSTSGFSAIHHGVPLLVIGDSLYANAELATCARGAPDFTSFWSGRHVASARLRKRYIAWITEYCLHPGDFFTRRGMEASCKAVIDAISRSCAQRYEARPAA